MGNPTNQLPTDGLILAIYKSGQMIRIEMSSGELRSIGQQLIAMADNVVIRGAMPQANQATFPSPDKMETRFNEMTKQGEHEQ